VPVPPPTPAPPATSDSRAPQLLIIQPPALAQGLQGNLRFSATASDDVALARIEFQVDGVTVGNVMVSGTTASGQLDLDTGQWASGQHVLRARAHDLAGKESDWQSLQVQLSGDRAAPAGVVRHSNWISGLSSATAFAAAADGRLFVAEQNGNLRLIKASQLQPTPVLRLAVDARGERGLIGVALHPQFAANGLIYLHHTSTEGGSHNRISQVRLDPANPDVALAGSLRTLVALPTLSGATNHNGGAMHFGVDGKLYVGVGDNANPALAPDLNSPLGKLLRLNDDGSIPPDNPHYASRSGLARAIWAHGLRNPFTFAVQPGSGRMHINDVGQVSWEEINLGAAGADYGWPRSEGPGGLAPGITSPLFAYPHVDSNPPGSGPGGFFIGSAIAGGSFYPSQGPLGAPWQGNYFFADFVSGFIGLLDIGNSSGKTSGNGHAYPAYSFGRVDGNPVDMLSATDGALLVLTRSGITRFARP